MKRRDPFCEEDLPLEDFAYRWLDVDGPSLAKEKADAVKPHWGVNVEALGIGELSASGGSSSEPTIADTGEGSSSSTQTIMTTLIMQKEPKFKTAGDVRQRLSPDVFRCSLLQKPLSFMVVRGRNFE